jgi:bifunctional non-homologous end joining protein LigD
MAIRPSKQKGAARSPLRQYDAKRDFSVTPEPPASDGEPGASDGASRFVIHEHHASRLHWDLRLERDGVLVSWALPKGLPEEPGDNRFAAATEDHPLEYLGFSGEIPAGQYGAGKMWIWDAGTYDTLKWEERTLGGTPPSGAHPEGHRQAGKVEVALHGERVDARYALFPIEAGERPKDWMIHRMDPPADPAREPMPEHVVPMLARALQGARTGELPSDADAWAYEVKWDGVRAIAYSRPGELRLESRNLNDVTDSYPELVGLNRALSSHSAILDGEIVAFDELGRPSFAALQRRMHVASRAQARRLMAGTPVTLMLFDVLWLDGHSLMGLTYLERRELLAAMALDGEHWRTPEHVLGDGAALLEASAAQGLEGVVAKRVDSTYRPGARGSAWVKVKTVARQELVVGGWMPGKGKRTGTIGALLLGVHDRDGSLRYAGRVGSGFTERELARLEALLAPLARASSPFTAGAKPPREAVFAEPRLVVEVQFASWTDDGSLRAPVYVGVRDDKDPGEVVREDDAAGNQALRDDTPAHPARLESTQREDAPAKLSIDEDSAGSALTRVGGHELKLSNLEKVLYPRAGVTKREVIDYYANVASVLLAHLAGRPLTVTRWPDGVDGKSFFQKHAPAHRPGWVRTASLPARTTLKGTPPLGAQAGKQIDYVLADDLPTLVWLANLAALELHVPLARAEDIGRPTAVVFDLDPGEPAGIVECCRVAALLRGVFEGIGLRSFAKTSGSKGVQVYIPLNHPHASYERTKPFAKAVAELLEQEEPDLVVARMTRSRRAGKVLIDWSQNDARKTTVCAYSLRAGERPTVSTPLEWDEVEAARDGRASTRRRPKTGSADRATLAFEAHEVLARVADKGDLFAPVLSLVQELPG